MATMSGSVSSCSTSSGRPMELNLDPTAPTPPISNQRPRRFSILGCLTRGRGAIAPPEGGVATQRRLQLDQVLCVIYSSSWSSSTLTRLLQPRLHVSGQHSHMDSAFKAPHHPRTCCIRIITEHASQAASQAFAKTIQTLASTRQQEHTQPRH